MPARPWCWRFIDRADAVLLDLREFTPERKGTHFELVQLLRRAELRKVRVLAGAGDAMPALHAALQAAWREAGREAQLGGDAPRLQMLMLMLNERSDAQVKALAAVFARAAEQSNLSPARHR